MRNTGPRLLPSIATFAAAVGACLALLLPMGTPATAASETSGTNASLVTRLVVYYKNNEPLHPDPRTPTSAFTNSAVIALPVPMTIAEARIEAARLARNPEVHAVLVDRPLAMRAINTNDSQNFRLWNLWSNTLNPPTPGSSRTEPVWTQYRGSGVTVAVLDTGRLDHEDLTGAWVSGYDMISGVAVAGDGNGRDSDATDAFACATPGDWTPHGLMVASVIAARINNVGIAGVAPLSSIMPVRVLSSCNGGNVADLLDGMRWAVGLPVQGVPTNPNPARVLNLSLGSSEPDVVCDDTIQAVVDEVRATGAVIVVATGNEGRNSIAVPAACAGVIAVSASSRAGTRAGYSNVGQGTTIAAPGGDSAFGTAASLPEQLVVVASQAAPTLAEMRYARVQGTSFATPHVAGAAALLLEQNASLSADAVKSRLVNSARAFAPGVCDNDLCGVGLLDVERAMALNGFTVEASASRTHVRSGQTVTMTATTGGGALSPTGVWEQTAGQSVALTVSSDGMVASYTAPAIDQALGFRVVVTDASNYQQFASVATRVSVAPQLAAVAPLTLTAGDVVDQSISLATGGVPQAVEVDDVARDLGIRFQAGRLQWANAQAGDYQVQLTPYDAVGAGIPTTVAIAVKQSTAVSLDVPNSTSNTSAAAPSGEAGGGGGALGLHGMLLLALAFIARRRLGVV